MGCVDDDSTALEDERSSVVYIYSRLTQHAGTRMGAARNMSE